jgi:hypothetical protein
VIGFIIGAVLAVFIADALYQILGNNARRGSGR